MASAQTTTDHDAIRRWVEERDGRPAHVMGTGDNDAGLLRIEFPDVGDDDKLEAISWEDFFEKFEDQKLAFLHQDETSDGSTSRFNKLVSRESSS